MSTTGYEVSKMTQVTQPQVKVLLVDDDPVDLEYAAHLLIEKGYRVRSVSASHEVIDVFEDYGPDLVLMDIMMPGIDGQTIARELKQKTQSNLVPIIFVSGTDDEKVLARCFELGAFDVMRKPLSANFLVAKIVCALRQTTLNRKVLDQRDILLERDANMMRQQLVAKRVFEKVVQSGCLRESEIQYRLSPISLFNGDMLLAAPRRDDGVLLIVGDFTGHGLSAALGAIPVAEVFYAMASKGFSVGEIAAEINTKLRNHLPIGRFLAASVIELDRVTGTLAIWNGGIPVVFLHRPEADEHWTSVPSSHLPLGVLAPSEFDSSSNIYEFSASSALFACTDGLSESTDLTGEMYGQHRIEQCITQVDNRDEIMPALLSEVRDFLGSSEQTDDATMVMLPGDCRIPELETAVTKRRRVRSVSLDGWELCVRFEADALMHYEMHDFVGGTFGLVEFDETVRRDVSLMLKELITNAIEHGILGLDKSLKASPEGFQAYYCERDMALAKLEEGYVEARITAGSDGRYRIAIGDSGGKIDEVTLGDLDDLSSLQGRGLAIISSLCEQLDVLVDEQLVVASYRKKSAG